MLNLKDLEYIQHIAKSGSILKSAHDIGLSQPALTKRIQNLETLLGSKLFDRHPKGVKLTDTGKTFIQESRKLLAHSDDFINRLSKHTKGQQGNIRLGLSPILEGQQSRNCLCNFNQNYPDVSIHMEINSTPTLVDFVKNGILDFAFIVQGYQTKQKDNISSSTAHLNALSFEPLLRIPLTCIVRKNHPVLKKRPFNRHNLFKYPMVSPMPTPTILNNLNKSYNKINKTFKTPTIHINDYRIALSIIENTNAWTSTLLSLHDETQDSTRFHIIGQLPETPTLTIGLIKRTTWSTTPTAINFIDNLMELFTDYRI